MLREATLMRRIRLQTINELLLAALEQYSLVDPPPLIVSRHFLALSINYLLLHSTLEALQGTIPRHRLGTRLIVLLASSSSFGRSSLLLRSRTPMLIFYCPRFHS